MTNDLPDWEETIGQQDEPLPQTTAAPDYASSSYEIVAGDNAYFSIVSAAISNAYKCYLDRLIISVPEKATRHDYEVVQTGTAQPIFKGNFFGDLDLNMGKWKMTEGTNLTIRVNVINNHPTRDMTFFVASTFYKVER